MNDSIRQRKFVRAPLVFEIEQRPDESWAIQCQLAGKIVGCGSSTLPSGLMNMMEEWLFRYIDETPSEADYYGE